MHLTPGANSHRDHVTSSGASMLRRESALHLTAVGNAHRDHVTSSGASLGGNSHRDHVTVHPAVRPCSAENLRSTCLLVILLSRTLHNVRLFGQQRTCGTPDSSGYISQGSYLIQRCAHKVSRGPVVVVTAAGSIVWEATASPELAPLRAGAV